MNTELLPYIFGSGSLLIGLFLFLLAFGIYQSAGKTEKQQIRFNNRKDRYGGILKIISVLLILNGAYDLIQRDADRYRIGIGKQERAWTPEDKASLIEDCLRDAKTTAEDYPEISKKYCDCSISKIMDSLTYVEYVSSLTVPEEKQIELMMPIIQDCFEKFKHEIDSAVLKAGIEQLLEKVNK